jgi:transglutaminase-like putative cysteine protease
MWTVTDNVYKENVTLTVNIPEDFGVVKYEPSFLSSKEEASGTVLSGQRLGVGADTDYYLSVEFADEVVRYDVTYRYTFVNQGSATESTPEFEVPGPLEGEGQEISQISYDPSPISTSYDESGNLRAKFRTSPIAPGDSATITIHFVAKITLPPAISDSYSGGLGEIPSELMKYTAADEYWEVSDATIRSLSQNLTRSEASVLNKVKAIYNYVVDNIEYDDAKFQLILSGHNPGRYGAVETLALGRGVCEDISDLFVTLCRASGIPAFVVSGPTYDGDGLTPRAERAHAWTEVYIPGYGWLQVDPTWKLFGRLEGRHITEQLQKDSSDPKYVWWWLYQPFSYELEYDITFLTTGGIYRPALSVSADYDAQVSVRSTLNLRLTLSNSGNGTAYATNVTIAASDRLMFLNVSSYSLGKLRGYETRDLNLVFNASSLGNASIVVTVKYQAEEGGIETRTYNYTVVVTEASTTLSCGVSPSEITAGNSIRVAGSISPILPGRNITLTYTRPDGRSFARILTTGPDGSYSDLYQPDANGSWSVYASWEGDAEHQGALSQSVLFNVAPAPPGGGSRCIIATATYGSELAPQVQFLRDFRENVAMKTFAGSSFMVVFNMWYYSWSPPVADTIAFDPTVRGVMRVILQPLLDILRLSTATFSLFSFNGEVAVIMAGLVASALIGIVYFVPITAGILVATTKLHRSQSVPRPDCLKVLAIPWVASVALMLLGEVAKAPLLMMIATSAFVILTIAIVVVMTSLKIASLLIRHIFM